MQPDWPPELASGYARAPLGARLHARVRWWSCPFAPLAEAVATRGRILEIGCGHGLLCLYLARAEAGRSVVGIDLDASKIRVARQAAAGLSNLGFEVASAGELPAGPWDAILLIDVLYLLDVASQRALIERCAAQLAPGGALVIKEMAPAPRWKFLWNAVQETLAVRVLKLTRGAGLTFTPPAAIASWLEGLRLAVHERPLDRGYLHPHYLLVGVASAP